MAYKWPLYCSIFDLSLYSLRNNNCSYASMVTTRQPLPETIYNYLNK